jgi:two-component system, chemotaxis family, chemotaxis protein CheY
MNVLIVDDSAVMRAMVGRTLRLSQLPIEEVVEASNGAEALGVLQQRSVDLALIDINMPVMNGMELLEHIRDDWRTSDVAVLVISTESSATRIEELRARGALFLSKPFTPETLRSRVLQVIGEAHA